jgi:ABC-2 type transport system permease protein
MRAFWPVFFNELHRKTLDFSFLVTSLVAPFVMSVILGLAFGHSQSSGLVRIGILIETKNADVVQIVHNGIAVAALPNAIKIDQIQNFSEGLREIKQGSLDSLIVIPSSFAQQNSGKQTQKVTVSKFDTVVNYTIGGILKPQSSLIQVISSKNSSVGSSIAQAIVGAIESRFYTGALVAYEITNQKNVKIPVPDYLSLVVKGAAYKVPLKIKNSVLASGRNIIGYYAPSMAIIFLFIGSGLGARTIVLERSLGTISRLIAAPVKGAPIVVAKVVAIMASGLISILALWLETSLIFHANWGSSLGVFLMCVSTVISMGGLAIFLTSFAKDDKQALTASVLVGFLLGLLSGNFFPPGSLPTYLYYGSLAVPNGWALVGFGRLSQEQLGWHAVIGPIFVLVLIGVIFGIASMFRINKVMTI